MKLVYRGIQYTNRKLTNAVKTNQPLTAKYRGIRYQIFCDPKPANSVNHILKYRGVNYHGDPNNNAHQKTAYSTSIHFPNLPNSITA